MTRKEVIKELKTYFAIEELVCPHTFARFGDKSWQFLSTEILHTLLIIRRDILRVPMILNTYHQGGSITQRGLRCNCCPLVRDKANKGVNYLSSHVLGNAFDCVFKPGSIDAKNARLLIKENAFRLPYPIRLEENIGWLHVDCLHADTEEKITVF